MADRTPACVAGEPLDLLEEALDRVRFEMEECGCIRVVGTLPPHLGDSLTRALITMEVEMLERGVEPYSGPGTDPFDELMVRVIRARPEP